MNIQEEPSDDKLLVAIYQQQLHAALHAIALTEVKNLRQGQRISMLEKQVSDLLAAHREETAVSQE